MACASSLMVNSVGFPVFTGPFVVVWFLPWLGGGFCFLKGCFGKRGGVRWGCEGLGLGEEVKG